MLRRTFLKVIGALAAVAMPVVAKPIEYSDETQAAIEEEGPYPFMMMHVVGAFPCGKPAAYMVEDPPIGSAVYSAQFRQLDGTRFVTASAPICGSCGRLFGFPRHGIVPNGTTA